MNALRNSDLWAAISRTPDEILENRLYVGGVAAAFDSKVMTSLGITHILSACSECALETPNTAPFHRTIAVDDTASEDLLIRLPEACQFIQKGIDEGGKVYVHCMMGVSRSVTVVCAYLMKTHAFLPLDALAYVQSKRPISQPNHGFMEQLGVWSACDYAPSMLNSVYLAWKRKNEEDYGIKFKSYSSEATQVADRVFIVEDLPQTAETLASFLQNKNVTHLLTLEPCQSNSMSESMPYIERCHLDVEDGVSEELVLKLPEAIDFIKRGIDKNPNTLILVHSFDITRICLVACAYLMLAQDIDSASASSLLELRLPSYSRTTEFTSLVSLYDTCQHNPTQEHPEIKKFRMARQANEHRTRLRSLYVQNMQAPWVIWQPPQSTDDLEPQ